MFRFTIRDVLWLMLVVALMVALWQSRRELSKEREQKMQWAKRSHAALHVVKQSKAAAEWFNDGIIVNDVDAATGTKRVEIFVGRAE